MDKRVVGGVFKHFWLTSAGFINVTGAARGRFLKVVSKDLGGSSEMFLNRGFCDAMFTVLSIHHMDCIENVISEKLISTYTII